MKRFLRAIAVITSAVLADSAVQSDWADGPGIAGPVTDWASSFLTCSDSCVYEQSGSVFLDSFIAAHLIEDSLGLFYIARSLDVDSDGDIDLVTDAYWNGQITLWVNQDGSGNTWEERTVAPSFSVRGIVVSDLDYDGDVDILANSSNTVRWWENCDGLGNTWLMHSITSKNTYTVNSSDIDADGDSDVISAHSSSPYEVIFWENSDGSGTSWIQHVIATDCRGVYNLVAVDIDGDGDDDVLASSNGMSTDKIIWWENTDGFGEVWDEHTVIVEYNSYYGSLNALDFDCDGDIDIVGQHGPSILWYENKDGAGTQWSSHWLIGGISSTTRLVVCDITGDGVYDILVADGTDDVIGYYEYLPDVWPHWVWMEVSDSLDGPAMIEPADIDDDGDDDLIVPTCEAHELFWFDLDARAPVASIESSILDVQCYPDWGVLLWSAFTPPGTSVSFQVRASANPDSMGSWSDTLAVPCSLEGLLDDGSRYLQYRAILATAAPDTTPALLDLTFTWDALGECEEQETPGYNLLPVSPNPAVGCATISFEIPMESMVYLTIFDVSGRIVMSTGPSSYPTGVHCIQLNDMPPGVFLCRMVAGEHTDLERFVVID